MNTTIKSINNNDNIAELIMASSRQFPEATALIDQGRHVSYLQLVTKAQALARILLQSSSNFCVLYMDNDTDRYVAMIASLLANKTYVPIFPDAPLERCQVIVEQLEEACFVVKSQQTTKVNAILALAGERLTVDERCLAQLDGAYEADWQVRVENPYAVMMFTSGSTGIPKGVLLSHANICRYIENVTSVFPVHEKHVFSHTTSYASDLHMHDLYVPWSKGAAVCLLSHSSEKRMMIEMKFNHVTHSLMVPAAVNQVRSNGFNVADYLPAMEVSMFAGEPLSRELCEYWAKITPNSAIYNFYGPAEATVAFTWHQWQSDDPSQYVPIGRAFDNQATKVLDDDGNPIRVGQGELYLSGSQITDGYFKDKVKTAKAYIEGEDGIVWYKTNDLVELSNTGSLTFLGRTDDRMKIAGYRIERLDLETQLKQVTGLSALAVVAIGDDNFCDDFVIYTPFNSDHDQASILNKCKQALPEYMRPAYVIFYDLPLSQNNKVNYIALRTHLKNWLNTFDEVAS
ncbi:AMP-binding protein [Pseudoalteromonas sp. S16_S37]|uniref:AMP-binding protein n=1 Tax=Pseudoalteromonas sp. S16_S37 TaxID=2720228 RepID=UPI0016807887|nr:AMP-binding protein [Pseudoalteromonas sp. S16_S37]MBD1584447.1 amino acid adenylation domain-containing protein [Pseudoalteromonas sp. S16_S37]